MCVAGDAFLEGLKDLFQITPQHGRCVEPEAWEDAAFDNSFDARMMFSVTTAIKFVPDDSTFLRDPDDALLNRVVLVDLSLSLEAIRPFVSDLANQFGTISDEVVICEPSLSTGIRTDEQVATGKQVIARPQLECCVCSALER